MEPVILLKPMSSLETCFLDENILFKPTTDRFTVFRGQPLCFQVAVSRGDEGEIDRSAAKSRLPVTFSGALAPYATARVVVSVAAHYPTYPGENPEPYLRTAPGLYPDLLRPLHYDGCAEKAGSRHSARRSVSGESRPGVMGLLLRKHDGESPHHGAHDCATDV